MEPDFSEFCDLLQKGLVSFHLKGLDWVGEDIRCSLSGLVLCAWSWVLSVVLVLTCGPVAMILSWAG